MVALVKLKKLEHKNIRNYHLYTTMEPCPMCFGTIIMMNIKNVHYVCKDEYAGAVALHNTIPYIKNRDMNYDYIGGNEEVFQLVIQTLFECFNYSSESVVVSALKKTNSLAVELSISIYNEYGISSLKKKSVEEMYDFVIGEYYYKLK